MKKHILLGLIALILSSCSYFTPHKMDVQQGNIFSEKQANKLRKGMTKSQVIAIMGSPIMMKQTFEQNSIDYVYTNEPGHQPMHLKRVTLWFKQGKVDTIEKVDEPDFN